MTLENCKMLLAHFEACVNDSSLSDQARKNARLALADMKQNLAGRGVSLKAADKKEK